MKAIIFGANGQDGYFLTKLLQSKNIEVTGVSRHGTGLLGDVGNYYFVNNLIKQIRPDYLFHFAALSTTNHEAMFDNHISISTGTLNVLESVRQHAIGTKIFLSGSAMQFKNEGLPINEQTAFFPSSPYSVARIQSVYAGRYFRKVFGLKVYVGYFFNHDSELRSENHINMKIILALKRILKGSHEILEIGNINVKKEFNYADDIIKAVWKLINQNDVTEAVIGSGKAYSIKDWIQYCFNKNKLDWNKYVRIKESFTPEYNVLVSDPTIIQSLGWKPHIDFHQLADIMMEGINV